MGAAAVTAIHGVAGLEAGLRALGGFVVLFILFVIVPGKLKKK